MKQLHQRTALAGLLAVALAISGCESMRHGKSSGASGTSGATGSTSGYPTGSDANPPANSGSAGSSGSSGTSGSSVESIQNGTSGSSGTSGTSGTSGSGTSGLQDDRGNTAALTPSSAPNSTVLAIEILPASGGISEGDSSMGASGAAGATGSSGGGQSYRVTVRMDDGSTQVVTHGSTPDFRSGDRVNVTSGAIQR